MTCRNFIGCWKTRYRYGTKECDADRLPKDDLEEAVFEQMVDVYRDSGVIADALEHLAASEAEVAAYAESQLLALRQEHATVRRSIDRYFAAFEEGSCRRLLVRNASRPLRVNGMPS